MDKHQDIREEIAKSDIEQLYHSVVTLLEQSSQLIQEMTTQTFRKDLKSDQSFVTAVDFAVEDLIRDYIGQNYPNHGVLGEERDDLNPDAPIQWITDPVDGTQNLVHGLPTYGVVIGVNYKGRPLAGGITHPCLDLMYSAAYKRGAFSKNKKIQIHDCTLLDGHTIPPQEILTLSTRACFQRIGEEAIFDTLMREHPSTRVYYDIFSTTRAVEGQVAAVIEFGMKAWDIAATEILISEAGGAYELVRDVALKSGHRSYSIIAGKPSVVKALRNKIGVLKK